jgi:hypothetical protein
MSPGTVLAERFGEPGGSRAAGLTAFDSERLERFAAAALTGILARTGSPAPAPERAARDAVSFARALLDNLNSHFSR